MKNKKEKSLADLLVEVLNHKDLPGSMEEAIMTGIDETFNHLEDQTEFNAYLRTPAYINMIIRAHRNNRAVTSIRGVQ